MIEYCVGNVLKIESGIIVHGCNNVGVMGAGIAREIKQTYPEVYAVYKKESSDYGLVLGTISACAVVENDLINDKKIIVNAITQSLGGTGRQVSYDAIEHCFINVVKLQKSMKNNLPIVFPKIGAGLGGGNWDIIEKIIDVTIPDTIKKICYVLE
jgi:O-acetyl-ADP-ribose deacetylase (regulator of RNase III)